LCFVACGRSTPPPTPSVTTPGTTTPPTGATPVRVLMLTATAGFRHDSIPAARQALTALASSTGELTVTATENIPDITADRLASYDVVMFALTTGELPFDGVQKAALIDFVNRGGGFIGIHSATDTLYDWPDYGRLVGAYFKEHPWTQEASVIVEDRFDPSTATLGASFRLMEEFYAFRDNPRPTVHVLLSLDATSVGASGDYPLAWSHGFGSGRAYYNALGHFSSTWTDARFQSQLIGAIKWAAHRN
jgi:type 1 glutamine amidotransferase